MPVLSHISSVTQEICTTHRHSLGRTGKSRQKTRGHLQTRGLGLGKELCVVVYVGGGKTELSLLGKSWRKKGDD